MPLLYTQPTDTKTPNEAILLFRRTLTSSTRGVFPVPDHATVTPTIATTASNCLLATDL